MKKEFIDHFFKIALDEMYHGADYKKWIEILNECFSVSQPERLNPETPKGDVIV